MPGCLQIDVARFIFPIRLTYTLLVDSALVLVLALVRDRGAMHDLFVLLAVQRRILVGLGIVLEAERARQAHLLRIFLICLHLVYAFT